MRILQLTKWLSPRADNGGKLRAYGLGFALSKFAEVDILGFHDGSDDATADAPRLSHYRNRHAVEMESGWRRAAVVTAALGSGQAMRTARFASGAYRRRVAMVLSERGYDAVQVEELSTLSNLPPKVQVMPLVFSSHNVESTLSPQLFRAGGLVLRSLAPVEARQTQAEECRALTRAGFSLAVSDEDKSALARLAPAATDRIHVVPNCVFDDVTPGPPMSGRPDEPCEIVSIGCLAWHPNAQGARWFVDEVLPRLRRLPCIVRFVGSGVEAGLANELAIAGCEMDGDVDDTLPYLHRARVAFVPLLTGGGTRLKIVEAWAAGVPVVSTPIGAQGLGVTDGVDLVVAGDAETFSAALRRVIEDDALYDRLRENGLRRAMDLRWGQQSERLAGLYRRLVKPVRS